MKNKILFILIMAGMVPIACKEEENPTPSVIDLTYGFEQNEEDWIGGFSDLPEEGHEIYELDVSHAPLPEEMDATGNAIRIQGHNRSDDLFMFLKKYVSGLEPSTLYHVVFDIELASQYPESSIGIGGSPGGSVFMKVGASTTEPTLEVEEVGSTNYLKINIDKGNQSQEGANMINIGTIGINGEEFKYELIHRNNLDRPFLASTDPSGGMWLIVGTDSGFEGLTILYYNKIQIRLEESSVGGIE